MASQPSAGAKTSKWGSFLTGLESRLDTILADEDVASKPKAGGAKPVVAEDNAAVRGLRAQPAGPNSPARPSSTSMAQNRLNGRLAKAIATKSSQKVDDSSAAASSLPSRTANPANVASSPRASTDSMPEVAKDFSVVSIEGPHSENGGESGSRSQQTKASDVHPLEPACVESEMPRSSMDSHRSASTRPSLDWEQIDRDRVDLPKANGLVLEAARRTPDQYEADIKQLRSDNQTAELRRQEETHEFLERIDALQSKLQYLTREAVETAKRASASTTPGSDSQKLASKDEKIALLIEEGQKLSQIELKHMSIIKKLRAKSTEDGKALGEYERRADKIEPVVREAQDRAKRAEAAERRAMERAKPLAKLENDLESMRSDRDAKIIAMDNLQKQLSEALTASQEAEGKAHAEALEIEKRRTAVLVDDLSRLRSERVIAEKRYTMDIRELKERAERDKERARIIEIERQSECSILESRLEAFRARAEDASAGSTGDVQARSLRQVEILQNQYAVASENWQGIEGSLLARVTTLEKERDEISKREADVRRKAREMVRIVQVKVEGTADKPTQNLKFRRLEEDLEQATARSQGMQHELSQQKTQLSCLQNKLYEAESDVVEARKILRSERENSEARQAQRIEDEKARQREELARAPDTPYHRFRTESPVNSNRNRKSSNPDKNSPHGRHYQGLAISGSVVERPVIRRSSNQPLRSSDMRPTSRQDSTTFTQSSLTNGAAPETPSITVDYQDDFFDGVQTPASPEHTINDVISASTAGAGPSVQLVERMSAAVRRLESEKAASKDELARLSQQRDEARNQVVSLMRETEEKRKADERIKALEKENQAVQERYSTTLEMLGEKSEQVEELKADVADLKEMYRDLVDSTMR